MLEAKINLFELVVGELDMILGRVDDDFDFESSVFDALTSAPPTTPSSPRPRTTLGDELARARTGYLHTRGAVDQLVGED